MARMTGVKLDFHKPVLVYYILSEMRLLHWLHPQYSQLKLNGTANDCYPPISYAEMRIAKKSAHLIEELVR